MNKATQAVIQGALSPGQERRAQAQPSAGNLGQNSLPPSHRAPLATAFVLVIWAGMLLAALVFVVTYGSSIPFGLDDWVYVPFITGHEPVTLKWLWEQVAQHRYFLNRAAMVSLLKLGQGDFRTVLVFDVLALGAASFALIWVARSLRGRTSYADAFFPLIMLNWGLAKSHMLWTSGLIYILPTVLATALLAIVAHQGLRLRLWTGLLAGILLVMLALSSGTGILYTPPLAIWLGLCGLRQLRSSQPHSEAKGLVFLSLAATACLIVGLFFVDFQWHGYGAVQKPDYLVKFRVALNFLQGGFGPAANDNCEYWDYVFRAPGQGPGLPESAAEDGSRYWKYLRIGGPTVFLLLGVCFGILIYTFWDQASPHRFRALGLLLFMASLGCLAGAMGWGREALGDNPTFYYVLPLPILFFIYLVAGITRWKPLGTGIQFALFAAVVAFLVPNTWGGYELARQQRDNLAPVVKDLRQGIPTYQFFARHQETIWSEPYGGCFGWYWDYTRYLKEAEMGPFRNLQADPPFQEITLPLTPSEAQGITWTVEGSEGKAQGQGAEACLTFTLPTPMHVACIRIRGHLSTNDDPDIADCPWRSPVQWRRGGEAEYQEKDRSALLWYGKDGVEGIVCIDQAIDQFKIYPDDRIEMYKGSSKNWKPFVFKVSEITLLVPETQRQKGPPQP